MTAGRLEDDVVRARLWAAGVSLALLILAVAATGMALFAPGGTGLERIVRALGSGPVLAGLVLCAATGGYVACLCAGLWRSQDGRLVERLHLLLHMSGFYAVILLMLSIGSRVW